MYQLHVLLLLQQNFNLKTFFHRQLIHSYSYSLSHKVLPKMSYFSQFQKFSKHSSHFTLQQKSQNFTFANMKTIYYPCLQNSQTHHFTTLQCDKNNWIWHGLNNTKLGYFSLCFKLHKHKTFPLITIMHCNGYILFQFISKRNLNAIKLFVKLRNPMF